MERVQQGIQLCIRDNPSTEMANKRLPGLLEEFDKKIAAKEAALKKQEAIADTEQKELENSGDA
jgi:hypothetical protein